MSLPPRPNVNPIQTIQWMGLANENTASAIEKVIMNNQRVIAVQNQHTAQLLELILGQMTKETNRGPGVVSAADEAAKTLRTEWVDTLVDHYIVFIQGSKKKRYLTRIPNAMPDALEWYDNLYAKFSQLDANHPLLPVLTELNLDLKLDIYAFLGRQKKSRDQKKKDANEPSNDSVAIEQDEVVVNGDGRRQPAGPAKPSKREENAPRRATVNLTIDSSEEDQQPRKRLRSK